MASLGMAVTGLPREEVASLSHPHRNTAPRARGQSILRSAWTPVWSAWVPGLLSAESRRS